MKKNILIILILLFVILFISFITCFIYRYSTLKFLYKQYTSNVGKCYYIEISEISHSNNSINVSNTKWWNKNENLKMYRKTYDSSSNNSSDIYIYYNKDKKQQYTIIEDTKYVKKENNSNGLMNNSTSLFHYLLTFNYTQENNLITDSLNIFNLKITSNNETITLATNDITRVYNKENGFITLEYDKTTIGKEIIRYYNIDTKVSDEVFNIIDISNYKIDEINN